MISRLIIAAAITLLFAPAALVCAQEHPEHPKKGAEHPKKAGAEKQVSTADISAGIKKNMTSSKQTNSKPHINTMTRAMNVNVYQVAPGVYIGAANGMMLPMNPSRPSYTMADFKKLRVWRKAHALALNANRIVAEIRGADHKPLRVQMNRAAMSIPTNIVEGRGKRSDRDFARFLGYALGSATELEYHIMVARDIGAIAENDAASLLSQVVEIKKMLRGLIDRLFEQ